MISLKLDKTGGVELDDKKSTAVLGDNVVKINDQTFSTPGEYELNNIEVVFGTSAALIVWEKLQMIYLFKADTPTDFEKSQFSSADVLILANGTLLNKKDSSAMIEQYDPTVVVINSKNQLEEGLAQTLKLQETNTIKLSVASLPEEGVDSYLLV